MVLCLLCPYLQAGHGLLLALPELLLHYTWLALHHILSLVDTESSGFIENGIYTFDPVIVLLGIYPKNPEALIGKNICTPMFIAVLFTIAKIWKQPKCPSVGERIKKWWYIHTVEYT